MQAQKCNPYLGKEIFFFRNSSMQACAALSVSFYVDVFILTPSVCVLSVPASEHSAYQRSAPRGHQDRWFRSVSARGQQVGSAWDPWNSRVYRWVRLGYLFRVYICGVERRSVEGADQNRRGGLKQYLKTCVGYNRRLMEKASPVSYKMICDWGWGGDFLGFGVAKQHSLYLV